MIDLAANTTASAVSVPAGSALIVRGESRVYVVPPAPFSIQSPIMMNGGENRIGPFPVAVSFNIVAGPATVQYLVLSSTQEDSLTLGQKRFTGVEYATDARNNVTGLVGPDGVTIRRFEAPQGSNVATKCQYGFMDVATMGVDRNFHVQTVTDAHFDAVRIGLFNSHTVDVTGVYSGVGVSAALGSDLSATTITMDTFVAATWGGGNASTTLLAGSGAAPTLTLSDWMPINSLDRTDGGTLPVLHIRTFLPSTNASASKFSPDSTFNWMRSETLTGGRPYRCMLQDVANAVTTPANFTSTANAVRWYPMLLQYRARGIVRNLLVVGDSIVAGVGATQSLNSQFWQARAAMSSSELPMEFANLAWSGQTVAQYKARLTVLIAAGIIGKGHLVGYETFSPNDGTPSQATVNVLASTTAQAIAEIQAAGAVPLLQLGSPANFAQKAWGSADQYRQTMNAKYRAAPNIRVLDMAVLQAATTTNGGQYDFASGQTTDGLHPNDTGIATLLPYTKAAIV